LDAVLNIGVPLTAACRVEFGSILVWFFMCDRTDLFWQAEKVGKQL
jgi:hypothetical protein